MYKSLTANSTNTYISILHRLVGEYNNTYHSTVNSRYKGLQGTKNISLL